MRFGRTRGLLSRWCWRYKRACLFCLYTRALIKHAIRFLR